MEKVTAAATVTVTVIVTMRVVETGKKKLTTTHLQSIVPDIQRVKSNLLRWRRIGTRVAPQSRIWVICLPHSAVIPKIDCAVGSKVGTVDNCVLIGVLKLEQ